MPQACKPKENFSYCTCFLLSITLVVSLLKVLNMDLSVRKRLEVKAVFHLKRIVFIALNRCFGMNKWLKIRVSAIFTEDAISTIIITLRYSQSEL